MSDIETAPDALHVILTALDAAGVTGDPRKMMDATGAALFILNDGARVNDARALIEATLLMSAHQEGRRRGVPLAAAHSAPMWRRASALVETLAQQLHDDASPASDPVIAGDEHPATVKLIKSICEHVVLLDITLPTNSDAMAIRLIGDSPPSAAAMALLAGFDATDGRVPDGATRVSLMLSIIGHAQTFAREQMHAAPQTLPRPPTTTTENKTNE